MKRQVYAIENQHIGEVKIGQAQDPEARLKVIAVGSSAALKVLMSFPSDNALAAERSLHLRFAEFRTHLEWFKLPADILKNLQSIMQSAADSAQPKNLESGMSERIVPGSELIEKKLNEQGLSRSDLARRLGISRQVVTRTLNSTALLNERAEHWPAILDALGLEVVIRPKSQQ